MHQQHSFPIRHKVHIDSTKTARYKNKFGSTNICLVFYLSLCVSNMLFLDTEQNFVVQCTRRKSVFSLSCNTRTVLAAKIGKYHRLSPTLWHIMRGVRQTDKAENLIQHLFIYVYIFWDVSQIDSNNKTFGNRPFCSETDSIRTNLVIKCLLDAGFPEKRPGLLR